MGEDRLHTTDEESRELTVHASQMLWEARALGTNMGLKANSAAIVILMRALAMVIADHANGDATALRPFFHMIGIQLSEQIGHQFGRKHRGER